MTDILVQQFTSIGGPVLFALVTVSLAATAVTIFKVVQFFQLGVGRHRAARAALSTWNSGDEDAALRQAMAGRSALCEVVAAGMSTLLRSPADKARAREIATQTALYRLNAMTAHLRILEAVVQAAPMLGLLGTVIGMIDAFGKLSEGGGAVDPGALAGGIWVALITTAVGLIIAIPFYFLSVWLESRVERERDAMEAAIAAVLNARASPAPAPERQDTYAPMPQAVLGG